MFKKVTRPLVKVMIAQINTIPDKDEQQTLINEAKLKKAQGLQERSKQIDKALPISVRQVIRQIKTVCPSNRLNAIVLDEHGFNLSKGEFRDALVPRFKYDIKDLPSRCPFTQRFDIIHAMNCNCRLVVFLRNNDIRDLGQIY